MISITYFPTRMNASLPANDTIVSSLAGTVTLNFADNPMNDIASNAMDTLHSDYAFVVAPYPVQRRMIASAEADLNNTGSNWDFTMFPNPANDVLHVVLPPGDVSIDIDLLDMSGKRLYGKRAMATHTLEIPIANMAKGAYCVRVSHASGHKMKVLVIN